MNKDRLQSTNLQSETPTEDLQRAAAPTGISYPVAAKVISHSGTDDAYTITVGTLNTQGTNAGAQWEQIYNEGQTQNFTALPYIWVTFNRDLPNGANWTLRNSSGMSVDSGSIKNASVRQIKPHFGMLSNGQPSLPGQDNFSLQLDHVTPGSFLNHEVDSTGGGLVIIANVDGGEEYFDPTRRFTKAEVEVAKEALRLDEPLR